MVIFSQKSPKFTDFRQKFGKIHSSRVIPSFRPRFAGKCDRQSRDLTQLTSGYISRLNRLLITPDHHVRTHTWESIAQKYSMENMNIFYPLPGIDLGHLCFQVERVLHWAMPPSNAFSTEICLLLIWKYFWSCFIWILIVSEIMTIISECLES